MVIVSLLHLWKQSNSFLFKTLKSFSFGILWAVIDFCSLVTGLATQWIYCNLSTSHAAQFGLEVCHFILQANLPPITAVEGSLLSQTRMLLYKGFSNIIKVTVSWVGFELNNFFCQLFQLRLHLQWGAQMSSTCTVLCIGLLKLQFSFIAKLRDSENTWPNPVSCRWWWTWRWSRLCIACVTRGNWWGICWALDCWRLTCHCITFCMTLLVDHRKSCFVIYFWDQWQVYKLIPKVNILILKPDILFCSNPKLVFIV